MPAIALRAFLPSKPGPRTLPGRKSLTDRVLELASRKGRITSSEVRLATGAPSHLVAAALRALVVRGALRDTGEQGPRMAGRGKAPRVFIISKKAGTGST